MFNKKLFAIIILSLILITFISGCIMQSNEQTSNKSNNQTSDSQNTENTEIPKQEEIPPMPPGE